MSGYRRRPKTIANLAVFGDDMTAISKVLLHYEMSLHTGGDHYRLLRDLHMELCDVTLKISGQSDLPWGARGRGGTWPK